MKTFFHSVAFLMASSFVWGNIACNPVGAQQVAAPEKGTFYWGVSGHPEAEYEAIGIPATLKLLKELGCNYYRIDERSEAQTAKTESLLRQANEQGIKILPIIYRPSDIFAPTISPQEIYQKCYQRGFNFAAKYKGQFDYIELDNELEARAIKPSDGSLPNQYKDDEYTRIMNALKGLSDGVRAADPNVKRLIGTAGWYHYGFLDRLIADGVQFEVISWHWYTDMGSMSRVMSKLSSYNKPIWVTEMNLKDARRNTKADEQGEAVANYANEMWNFPNVEAVFVYELLDQPSKMRAQDPDDPEPYYGLYTVEKGAANQWQLGQKKPAFMTYQERIRSLGYARSSGDIIVDDSYQAPATSLMGNDSPRAWQIAEDKNAFLGSYLHTTATTSSGAVRFKPFIPKTGQYEVSMWFPSSPANASDVAIKVQHANGTSTATINQQDGGRWVTVGTYTFNQGEPGDAAYIEVAGKNRSGRINADAVKFHLLP